MAQYTQEQTSWLSALSGDILMAVLLVDTNSKIGTLREFRDGMKFIADAKKQYPQNVLIQNMRAEVETSIQDIQSYSVYQQKSAISGYEERIGIALGFLANDAEAKEFKNVLLQLAQTVAGSAGFGIFGSGEKVSIAEASFIDELKRKMGIIA